jgi:hypothetical protein
MAEITTGYKGSRTKAISWPLTLSALAPLFFIVSTIIGAVRWFSPVPFWDMWDGTLATYIRHLQGAGWSFLFEQANEHRIVLSKILFWADYRFFGGLSYFLIAMNIVLMFALWAALCWAASMLLERRLAWLCSALMGVMCFSWIQYENITWGYQSQFYLAYLLPLLAFILLARWIREPRESRFVAAVVLGVLSTVTMANGVLALPLLAAMLALSGKCTRLRMGALLLAMALTYAAWIHNYAFMPHEGASASQMVEFLLMFLGGTFWFLYQQSYIVLLGGVAVLYASAYVAYRWFAGERDAAFLALFMFVAYVGAAAASATFGRAHFGAEMALAGRYETPLMLMYSAFLLLFAYIYRNTASTQIVIGTATVFVPLLLMVPQVGAFSAEGPVRALQRMQAALALDLGVKDDAQIGTVYPVQNVNRVVGKAIQFNLSIFGLPSMRLVREAIGKTPAALDLQECRANVDGADPVATDNRYMTVRGWAFDERTQTVPPVVFLVADGIVSGAAISGGERPDVAHAVNPGASKSGFVGYVSSSAKPDMIVYCQR